MISVYSSDMKYAFVSKKRTKNGELLQKRSRSWKDWYTETEWGLFTLFFTGLLLIIAAIKYGFIPLFFWQFQSYCKIKWVFENQSCSKVQDLIGHQISTWGFNAQCWGYHVEGCKYQLFSVSNETLHAQHTTNYTAGIDVQDLIFRFSQEGDKCVVEASAISLPNLGTLFMDAGSNYCTLRNLPRAAGLIFLETAEPNECSWRAKVTCVFESGCLKYHRPPHVQGIYEKGRLISSMLIEGDDLDVQVIEPTEDVQDTELEENQMLTIL